ncbi:MAG TPA: zinc-dependent metalloprotease family protein [Chitinophagaceae bacterium]|nr:zinc-dependent metalloprotease family protein [Chitinophagaceae bacterium]
MKKFTLLVLTGLICSVSFGQQNYWTARSNKDGIVTDKAVARLSYPKEFRLFDLNIEPLKKNLFAITDKPGHSTVISLPDANGNIEQFEVFEASNFDPALQARYTEIRAFSGRGIMDRYATLKLTISPTLGIQTMVFRAGNENEYIESYSQDRTVYSVFRSQREKGKLPWVCSTVDEKLAAGLNAQIYKINNPESNTGQLKTIRLAQSCNGEYSNWFGAFAVGQYSIVLAAFNATLGRCNGCYEKDLGLHTNLIPNDSLVVFYDPSTDPYSSMGNWNNELQATLTAIIGEANYDLGHMFGASGGGGNAGCIGCVCVDGQKGRGITSPADGIPMGDNFDIDYVAHEVGHQLGGNHTFSFSNEGTGQNKEVGAGITIMGYAGITSYDPAPHSIDIFHETSIQQIQNNLAIKTCPITVNMTANNPPVVAPVSNYTIPKSTPFVLTGSATDPENDPITYCWEQNDPGTGQTGANSVAYPTKPVGPNWLSFPAITSGTRLMPRLSTILAGLFITPTLPGGDAICNIEALSSISRTLNFRLTVRDNHPYVPGSTIGQTQFTDMTVTVDGTSGPFKVTSPNTNVSWPGGSPQTITWDVLGTSGAPVNCANVKISLSTDGGNTFPTVLNAGTPNDGSEVVTIPVGATTTARVKIEAVGNIFFDISDVNFTITAPAASFILNASAPSPANCPAPATMQTTITATFNGGFTNPITLSASGNPGGTTVVFGTNPLTTATPSSTVTLTGTNTLSNGSYTITVTGVASGAPNQTQNITYTINPGAGPVINTQPAAQALCQGGTVTFTVAATGALTYQWQKSTDGGVSWPPIAGATGTSYTIVNVQPTDAALYRCVTTGQCNFTNSNGALLTVNTIPAITAHPQSATQCVGGTNTFSVTATGTALTYQWQSAATCAGPWTNVAGATSASYIATAVATISYQCIVTGTCAPAVTSNCATLTVVSAVVITAQPSNATVCDGSNASFTVAGSGGGLTYQWQVSTDGGATYNNVSNGGVYSGATAATLNITGATFAMNNYRYRCQLSNGICPTPGISNAAILTVNTLPAISASPTGATICVGGSNTFTVGATGTGITYQWQVSTDGGATYNNIAGATSASYLLSGAVIGQNNNRFRCVVSGTCTPSATSAGAILTVIAPVAITAQPAASTAVCTGNNTSFTIAGNSVQTIVYQWQVSTDGGATYNNVSNGGVYSGATTATLSITGATLPMNNYRYRCLLSNATCAVPTVSNASILTVNALPVVSWANSLTEQCSNNTTYVLTGGTPAGGVYSGTGVTGTNFNASVTGAGTFTLTYTYTDVNGCVNSVTKTITVRLQPTIGLTASLSSLLPGKISVLTATPSAGTGGTLTTNWLFNGNPIINTGNTRNVNVEQIGYYQVGIQETWPSTLVCSNLSPVVTITATPSDNLFIFPSPNDGRFTVSYYNNGGASTKRTVAIFDSKGSLVYSREFNITGAYTLIPVDLQTDNTGIYYVVVGDASGKKIATGKVHVR